MIVFQNKTWKKHNPICAQISDNPYRTLIIINNNNSRLGKASELLNLIDHQRDINKICLYVKDP